MPEIQVSAEQAVAAPPDTVYAYIADYRSHHPKFLPPAFSELQVEEGGVGAGTVVRFRLQTGGRVRVYTMQVDEPEPGRVLTESDTTSSFVTTFTVMPDGAGSRVRIDTRWQGAGGFGGLMERTFAPRVLKRLYADELNRLDAYARREGSSPA